MEPDDDLLVHAKDRAKLRGAYKELFEGAAAILLRRDPAGLDYETNIDEYDPEVRTTLPRLASCSSPDDVQRVLHEEFTRWFTPEDAGPPERYRGAALELWQLWQDYQSRGLDA